MRHIPKIDQSIFETCQPTTCHRKHLHGRYLHRHPFTYIDNCTDGKRCPMKESLMRFLECSKKLRNAYQQHSSITPRPCAQACVFKSHNNNRLHCIDILGNTSPTQCTSTMNHFPPITHVSRLHYSLWTIQRFLYTYIIIMVTYEVHTSQLRNAWN